MPSKPISVVKLGTVLAGATPFKLGNINDTYRGAVFTEAGVQPAILKDLEPKELANEVMSAAVGLLLELPIPVPVLAWASHDRLAAKNGPVFGDGRLIFASVDVARPQVAMMLRTSAGQRVLERLAAWRDLGRLYGFDAFVANIDRHAGNVLFSGDNEIWLIDHGWCFTGPRWTPSDLIPADKVMTSRLNDWLTPLLDNPRRVETASGAATIEIGALGLDFPDVAVANHMDSLLSEGDLQAVLSFLSQRCSHVPRLAAQSLGIQKMV
jgi:hypothetical protein